MIRVCINMTLRSHWMLSRIHKHTAFVHNMFNSPLEVAKFEGGLHTHRLWHPRHHQEGALSSPLPQCCFGSH